MPMLGVMREAEALSSLPGLRLAASITINIIQAMKDNESDLHRLSEDVVAHITFIHQACKKLEGPEGQPGIQFHNALDTFVKTLESIEVFVRGRVERNAFHRVMNSTADGAKIQEYRNKLTQIMRHLELELQLQSHELLRSIKAIVVRDSTEDAALIQRNDVHDLDHRPDAVEDGNGRNCPKCASSKSPKKKAESSTRESNHERVVLLSSSRKPKVESESEIDVGETTEEECTRQAAKRAGKKKAKQARTENVDDIPYSQPSTFNNPFALHALPMPNLSPYYPPPYHPWLYYQPMWMIPPPLFLGPSMPSINTYWTSNINSNNFTKTAVNNSGNDHSKHRTN